MGRSIFAGQDSELRRVGAALLLEFGRRDAPNAQSDGSENEQHFFLEWALRRRREGNGVKIFGEGFEKDWCKD